MKVWISFENFWGNGDISIADMGKEKLEWRVTPFEDFWTNHSLKNEERLIKKKGYCCSDCFRSRFNGRLDATLNEILSALHPCERSRETTHPFISAKKLQLE